MTLHVFKCSNRQTRTGLTADRTGGNLPAQSCQGGNWIYLNTININLGYPGRIGAGTSVEILEAITRDGYYINDATININEKVLLAKFKLIMQLFD